MIKKTIYIGNPAYVQKKDGQLIINKPDADYNIHQSSIPIEDIGMILLDHPRITITQSCINSLIDNKAVVISCGDNHMPNGLMLPIEGNDTQTEKYSRQIKATLPLRKNLWQQTVISKVSNQALMLESSEKNSDPLRRWAKEVKSGDVTNVEGKAAAYYWRYVLNISDRFRREPNEGGINAMLNYGYAILRAIVARALTSSGLLLSLGIFHKNRYNAFCLADDIMEPYRPFVDRLVVEMVMCGETAENGLTTIIKSKLLTIASVDIFFDRMSSPLAVGIHRTTASLARCYEGTQRHLQYPSLISLS